MCPAVMRRCVSSKVEVAFLFNEGARVNFCIIKLIHANSPMIVLRDIHRPRMPAAHDGLSKAQG